MSKVQLEWIEGLTGLAGSGTLQTAYDKSVDGAIREDRVRGSVDIHGATGYAGPALKLVSGGVTGSSVLSIFSRDSGIPTTELGEVGARIASLVSSNTATGPGNLLLGGSNLSLSGSTRNSSVAGGVGGSINDSRSSLVVASESGSYVQDSSISLVAASAGSSVRGSTGSAVLMSLASSVEDSQASLVFGSEKSSVKFGARVGIYSSDSSGSTGGSNAALIGTHRSRLEYGSASVVLGGTSGIYRTLHRSIVGGGSENDLNNVTESAVLGAVRSGLVNLHRTIVGAGSSTLNNVTDSLVFGDGEGAQGTNLHRSLVMLTGGITGHNAINNISDSALLGGVRGSNIARSVVGAVSGDVNGLNPHGKALNDISESAILGVSDSSVRGIYAALVGGMRHSVLEDSGSSLLAGLDGVTGMLINQSAVAGVQDSTLQHVNRSVLAGLAGTTLDLAGNSAVLAISGGGLFQVSGSLVAALDNVTLAEISSSIVAGGSNVDIARVNRSLVMAGDGAGTLMLDINDSTVLPSSSHNRGDLLRVSRSLVAGAAEFGADTITESAVLAASGHFGNIDRSIVGGGTPSAFGPGGTGCRDISDSLVVGGVSYNIEAVHHSIVAGGSKTTHKYLNGSAALGGENSTYESLHGSIVAGGVDSTHLYVNYSAVLGGISGTNVAIYQSVVGGGVNNSMRAIFHSFAGGGEGNDFDLVTESLAVGGDNVVLDDVHRSIFAGGAESQYRNVFDSSLLANTHTGATGINRSLLAVNDHLTAGGLASSVVLGSEQSTVGSVSRGLMLSGRYSTLAPPGTTGMSDASVIGGEGSSVTADGSASFHSSGTLVAAPYNLALGGRDNMHLWSAGTNNVSIGGSGNEFSDGASFSGIVSSRNSVISAPGACSGVGVGALVLGGHDNSSIYAQDSVMLGGLHGEARTNSEVVTGAGWFYGYTGLQGESQRSEQILSRQLEDSSPSVLLIPGAGPTLMPPSSTVAVTIDLAARVNSVGPDQGKSAFWSFKALVVTDASHVSSLQVNNKVFEGGDPLWSGSQASLSTSGQYLLINATGFDTTTTRWTATARLTQIKG